MAKKKKDCTFDLKNYDYICQIKDEKNLGSFSAALDYVISEHMQAEDRETVLAKKIVEEFSEKYLDVLTKMRRNINAADINIQILLEVINTFMINLEISQPYMTSVVKSDILKDAEDEVKKRITYFKQLKDNSTYKNNNNKGR